MIEALGCLFVIVLGCLGHFIYEWSNHNKLIGYFFAVNESTWEHIKLIVGPSMIWFILELHLYNGNENLFFVKFVSLIVMMLLIPIFFYSYKHFTKRSILIVDIISFIITAIIGSVLFHVLINYDFSNIIFKHIGYIGLLIIFIKYITSTYTPKENFIYEDPITNKYGIEGHSHGHDHKHEHDHEHENNNQHI